MNEVRNRTTHKDDMDTGYVAHCILCAKAGKVTPATNWTGYVLELNDERAEEVVAGSCDEHLTEFRALPHLDHISKSRFCVGVWKPEYGKRD